MKGGIDMFNLQDMFVKKERNLCIKEVDLIQTLKILDTIAREARFYFLRKMEMEIVTCNEYIEGAQWDIKFNLTENQWRTFIALMKDGKRKIVQSESSKFYLE